MPRTGRLVLPNHPHHVIQRGHNRTSVFEEEVGARLYLGTPAEWKGRLGCKVYAYCLMTNHVHLVLDPGDEVGNLALLMKRVAGKYTRFVNRVEQRSGTV
jgi:putative transposase